MRRSLRQGGMHLLILVFLVLQAAAIPVDFQSAFPGVGVLTGFAHDMGDTLEAVTFEQERYSNIGEATQQLLPRFGWDRPEQRARLGTVWVDRLVFFGSEVKSSGAGRSVELLDDGTFRYTTWTVSMRGRTPGSQSTRWQVEITPDAQLRTRQLEHVGMPL